MSPSLGVPLLDDHLASLEEPHPVLLFLSGGLSEKRALAERFVHRGLRSEETCLYVDFYRLPALLRADLHRMGEYDGGLLHLVDAASAQMMVPSPEPILVSDPEDLDAVRETVLRGLREVRPSRVVLDSLEYLAEWHQPSAVAEFCTVLIRQCREVGATLLLLLTSWNLGRADIRAIMKMADCPVRFRSSTRGGLAVNEMRILDGPKDRGAWTPFAFTDVTPPCAATPRIAVLGPHGAGKTTFVLALRPDEIVLRDESGPRCTGLQVSVLSPEVFGDSEGRQFEASLSILAKEVKGVILLLDGGDSSSVEASRPLLAVGKLVPLVVAVNKQDLPEAWRPDRVARALDIDGDFPVLGAVATTGEGVREAIDALLDPARGAAVGPPEGRAVDG